jgi:hypothetical protein
MATGGISNIPSRQATEMAPTVLLEKNIVRIAFLNSAFELLIFFKQKFFIYLKNTLSLLLIISKVVGLAPRLLLKL